MSDCLDSNPSSVDTVIWDKLLKLLGFSFLISKIKQKNKMNFRLFLFPFSVSLSLSFYTHTCSIDFDYWENCVCLYTQDKENSADRKNWRVNREDKKEKKQKRFFFYELIHFLEQTYKTMVSLILGQDSEEIAIQRHALSLFLDAYSMSVCR